MIYRLVGGPMDGQTRDVPENRLIFPPRRELTTAQKKAIPNYTEDVYVWGRHPETGERCLVWQPYCAVPRPGDPA